MAPAVPHHSRPPIPSPIALSSRSPWPTSLQLQHRYPQSPHMSLSPSPHPWHQHPHQHPACLSPYLISSQRFKLSNQLQHTPLCYHINSATALSPLPIRHHDPLFPLARLLPLPAPPVFSALRLRLRLRLRL